MKLDATVFADRSERGKLRLTGPQRLWFLHQILTQSFEDMQPGDARDAAMITAHGRLVGYLETLATDDALLCHFEAELRETLPDAIRRYVFATQVEIDDVTDDMGLVLVTGEVWQGAGSLAVPVLRHPTRCLGVDAGYLWVERSRRDELIDALRSRGGTPASEDELEAVRIANGVPRWGREMDLKTFPQEAGIDDYAVHYDKGCYVGQEAMAKIHFRGKVNRALRRLESNEPLPVGADVHLHGQKVGIVTSASNGRALGMLRHSVEPGELVTIGTADAKVVA